jgi:hypothetical protein
LTENGVRLCDSMALVNPQGIGVVVHYERPTDNRDYTQV